MNNHCSALGSSMPSVALDNKIDIGFDRVFIETIFRPGLILIMTNESAGRILKEMLWLSLCKYVLNSALCEDNA